MKQNNCSKCRGELTTQEEEFGWGDTCFCCIKNHGSEIDKGYLEELRS